MFILYYVQSLNFTVKEDHNKRDFERGINEDTEGDAILRKSRSRMPCFLPCGAQEYKSPVTKIVP